MTTEQTTEQTELIEKLNCLEFETSQLNHAYQLWRSNVEQGTAPDWMAAAIRITYDALIAFCLDTASALALDTSRADEIGCYARNGEIAPSLRHALPAEDNTTALCLRHGQRLQRDGAETDPPGSLTALIDGSLALTPVRQQSRIVGVLTLADIPHAFSARYLAQLEAAACEISSILVEESTTAEPYPELLPITEPDWSGPHMPVAISPPSTSDVISELPAIEQSHAHAEAEAEPATIHRLATLRLPHWLQGSSTRLFGAASVAVLASVAILMVVGAAIGIYLARPQHAAPRSAILSPEDSAVHAAAGTLPIPTSEKAGFKFDPDLVVTPLGSSFVLNAVLSRGSDVASVGVQIDYDPDLLQFMGVSEGGFLVKTGRQVVVAHRDDPLTGVLTVSAEQSPGNPGISGDGPVFALSFHVRKKGTGIVSIVPAAHDSQGRRIEMAGSQVAVRIN
jgi:Cohesin domain